MSATTNCNCRDCLPRGQEPEEVLSPREFAAVTWWRTVYQIGAIFGVDCWRDAERLTDRLGFQKWRAERGEGR